LIRMSSRFERAWKSFAACLTEVKDDRSSSRKVRFAFGTAMTISAIADSALDRVRAARYISLGSCLASCRMVSFPSPAFPGVHVHQSLSYERLFPYILPPVTRTILPTRVGISSLGSKDRPKAHCSISRPVVCEESRLRCCSALRWTKRQPIPLYTDGAGNKDARCKL